MAFGISDCCMWLLLIVQRIKVCPTMYELFEDAVGSIFQRKGDLELNHGTCGMKIGWLEED